MEGIAMLIGLVIKYGLLLISIIGLLRLWRTRSDGKKHYLTKVLTIIFTILSLYFIVGGYIVKKSKRNKIAADYNLTYYKCEKCPTCSVRLKKDGSYIILNNNREVDNGTWDFKETFEGLWLYVEDGIQGAALGSDGVIDRMKYYDCKTF